MSKLKFVSNWNGTELEIDRSDFIYVKLEDKENGMTGINIVHGVFGEDDEQSFHMYDSDIKRSIELIDGDFSEDEKRMASKVMAIRMVLRMSGMSDEDVENQTEISYGMNIMHNGIFADMFSN